MKTKLILLLASVFILMGCNENPAPKNPVKITPPKITDTSQVISYEVIIKPRKTTDQHFTKDFDQMEFVNSIYEGIKNKEMTAFDYQSQEQITYDDILALQDSAPQFKRENIGRLLFYESWQINPETNVLEKEIDRVILGYEFFNNSGELIGYKPIFGVKF